MSIYSRITSYSSPACHGEDAYCRPCGEFKAVCPDCESTVCVFCTESCDECGESMF